VASTDFDATIKGNNDEKKKAGISKNKQQNGKKISHPVNQTFFFLYRDCA